MWKKIGSIAPASNDNKSSRSKDQNTYQPFSQMSKIRGSQSQLFIQNNELFCPGYLSKKKGLQSKCFSQSRIHTIQQLNQVNSFKQLPQTNKPSTIKKRILSRDQAEEFKLRISQKIIDNIDESLDKQDKTYEQQNFPPTESTEIIQSESLMDDGIRKLKHAKSTPQLNFTQICQLSKEVQLDRKIQAQKNIKSLKKQHAQIKQTLNHQLGQFKIYFKKAEGEINKKLSEMMESTLQHQNTKASDNNSVGDEISLNFEQVGVQTRNLHDKFKHLNRKKAQVMQRLISVRGK